MTALVLVLLWIGLAASIVAALAIAIRRVDQSATGSQPIGVYNLPIPSNDYGPQAKRHRLRSVVIVVTAVVLASYSGRAQAQTVELSPLHVTAPAPSSCVNVQVEGARSISFDCLNQQLKADAQDQGNAPPTTIAKDAAGNGAPTTVGTFSYTGTSIRMGSNFGKSAFPQRPPAPSFTSALVPAGAR